ncbi:MAG TPA: hypothetical protein VFK47_21175 [Ktedonobacteraceae bacterium]|nr:hypothetical protein [Ktedonobacteraceae bacterium]
MDYTAGSGRHSIDQASSEANPLSSAPANSIRARAFAAIGGNVGMNISAGPPHILLFERDQQLMGLLTNELRQAGIECRAARTAVEVFDAIARYPIRMVLVNLAQAATARREFWVALDTQRRGRGIQVLTFHCTNLAGYGPAVDDDEERTASVIADLEVDGMLGVVNLINAVRSRLAASNAGATGTISKVGNNAAPTSPTGTRGTTPASSPPMQNAGHTIRGMVSPNPSQALSSPAPVEASRSVGTYTDKIRAVIYPNQRSRNTSTSSTHDNSTGDGQYIPTREQQLSGQEQQRAGRYPQNSDMPTSTPMHAPPPMVDPASRQGRRPGSDAGIPKESSLAQLSRMLQEQRTPALEELAQRGSSEPLNSFSEETTIQQRVRPTSDTPISSIPLRASPIQDMPVERSSGGQSDFAAQVNTRWHEDQAATHYAQASASPTLASLGMPSTPPSVSTTAQPPASFQTPAPSASFQRQTPASAPLQAQAPRSEDSGQFSVPVEEPPPYYAPPQASEKPEQEEQYQDTPGVERSSHYTEPNTSASMEHQPTIALPTTPRTPDNALLLDIMQSLPPMTSPPPQPQTLNGRATRSLGNVLLEGHLVPESRLEVAQGIQRMLSGVDMNYQLGEILLMFKLLTPDQLLAASLVSYGLITTTQISALGRIRQELHAIGLEYDLESLVILFRILTSEQLREVRAGWS